MPPTRARDTDVNHGLVIWNGGGLAEADVLVEFAVEADEAGWDGVFFGDHLIYPWVSNPDEYQAMLDPWITFAGIATRTDDIKLGTWISPVPRRQPWQLARNLATLDRLSDGRVLLGAGMGTTPDFTKFGQKYDQRRLGERFDEALEIITGLWRGEPFSYDGDHYTIDDAVVLPTPVQEPRIPIVIGGWWPFKASFHRGAQWDGIAPNWPSIIQQDSEIDIEELPTHIQEAVATQRSHEEEVREMLNYYLGLTDDPGEIILPSSGFGMSSDFVELSRDLGATWLLHMDIDASNTRSENLNLIRKGPPDR